jgi:hypothetical protein
LLQNVNCPRSACKWKKREDTTENKRRLPRVKGRACCRLRWFAVAETVARLGGAVVFLLLPRVEVPIPASYPSHFLSIFLFSVVPSLSFLYSSIFFLSFLLWFFFSLSVFFFLSIFLSSCSSSSYFSLLFCSLPLYLKEK